VWYLPLLLFNKEPQVKQKKVMPKPEINTDTGRRLPQPCPLPNLSVKTNANMVQGGLKGQNKFYLLRDAVTVYHGLCPNPSTLPWKKYFVMNIPS